MFVGGYRTDEVDDDNAAVDCFALSFKGEGGGNRYTVNKMREIGR